MTTVSRSSAPFRQARRAANATAFFDRQAFVRLEYGPEPRRIGIRAGYGSRAPSVPGPVGASPEPARAFPPK